MNKPFDAIVTSKGISRLISYFQKQDSFLFEKLSSSAKALLSVLLQEAQDKPLLILTATGREERKIFDDLAFFTSRPIVEIPASETLPNEHIDSSSDIIGARMHAIESIRKSTEPPIVLCSLQACLQKILSRNFFTQQQLYLKLGEKYIFDDLIAKASNIGYVRKNIVADKGEFAIRGGIIDIFPVNDAHPVRIEFFGEEIESIRQFDAATQTSTQKVIEVTVLPAKELEFIHTSPDSLETIFDLLQNPCIIFDDIAALEDKYASLMSAHSASKQFLHIKDFLTLCTQHQMLFFSETEIEDLSETRSTSSKKRYSMHHEPHIVNFEMFSRTFSLKTVGHPIVSVETLVHQELSHINAQSNEIYMSALASIYEREKFSIVPIYQNTREKELLEKAFQEVDIPYTNGFMGFLSSGLLIYDNKTAFIPLQEKKFSSRHKTSYQSNTPTSFIHDAFDLKPFDLVVHFHHGIGKFLGIEKKLNNQNVEQEYFLIEYADNSKLYVPLHQAYLITKYIGSEQKAPTLHTIGSNKWKKLREQTERSIVGYADELLKLYAKRSIAGGFTYPEDSELTLQFEEDFPFTETEDQIKAIRDVKIDMISNKAMDRLICGDVGYGKTEVAMRAAFKAVVDGKKQVAVLVPTTVLAMQHYENFVERMRNFPIQIAVLSRFCSQKEIKQAIEATKEGRVDILVGTHRILQKDISFKDLGLIIIDEEQRFGVKAKEFLKQLKAGVDCITLSATPIPRTLHMSLVGARDLSVINTPPHNRLPIKTSITENSDAIVQAALLRELARDGQAFYIHNRVETIDMAKERILKLVPKARIVVAHGQMPTEELEAVFHAFQKAEADILVSTTIIENGVDIPNANTIIVENADHFGLSELYQLRGRVGRWTKRAYAYFLIHKNRALSEIAQKRIETISQAGGFGGGMKVALRDLEIRGAGDILGLDQSGHISTVGFHLYCKLLKRTIDALQGKKVAQTFETKVDIPFEARLPDSYVNDVNLRMEIYQRLGEALSLEEVDTLWKEVRDRYGTPPLPAVWLYHMAKIRVYAAQKGYTHIKVEKFSLSLEQKKGANHTTRTVLFSPVKTAEELEKKLFQIL